MIPYSVLKKAIAQAEANVGLTKNEISECLLNAPYNLNHWRNMIMLPMDPRVARALRLPRHLRVVTAWNHPAYSALVLERLNGILGKYFPAPPQPCQIHSTVGDACAEEIADFQDELHENIIAAGRAGAASLEDMERSDFGLP